MTDNETDIRGWISDQGYANVEAAIRDTWAKFGHTFAFDKYDTFEAPIPVRKFEAFRPMGKGQFMGVRAQFRASYGQEDGRPVRHVFGKVPNVQGVEIMVAILP